MHTQLIAFVISTLQTERCDNLAAVPSRTQLLLYAGSNKHHVRIISTSVVYCRLDYYLYFNCQNLTTRDNPFAGDLFLPIVEGFLPIVSAPLR